MVEYIFNAKVIEYENVTEKKEKRKTSSNYIQINKGKKTNFEQK